MAEERSVEDNTLDDKQKMNTDWESELDALTLSMTNTVLFLPGENPTSNERTCHFFTGNYGVTLHRWLKRIEHTAAVYKWSEEETINCASSLLLGRPRQFVKFGAPWRTWKALKDALISEFSENLNSVRVHKRLGRRLKETDETYEEYIDGMLDISYDADIEEGLLIGYIIDHIIDDITQQMPFADSVFHGVRTIDKLKDKMKLLEQITSMSNE